MCSEPLLFGYPSRAHVFRAALVWLPFVSTCVQSHSYLVTLHEHLCSEPLLFGYPSRAHVFRAALVWLPFLSTCVQSHSYLVTLHEHLCSEPLLFGYPLRAHVFRAALVWLPLASTCVQSRSCLVRSALFTFVFSFLCCVLFALFVSVCVLCARVPNVARVSKLSIFELIQRLWCSLCMSE
jgi:hypothetical protein